MSIDTAALDRGTPFEPGVQCHWCGSHNLDSAVGYAGERACLKCGWGGDGEPDVPCMFYKISRQRAQETHDAGN